MTLFLLLLLFGDDLSEQLPKIKRVFVDRLADNFYRPCAHRLDGRLAAGTGHCADHHRGYPVLALYSP